MCVWKLPTRLVNMTLVVLAGGMGSRYGGLKQLDVVGSAGEAILDFSVLDAIAAGFERVVFVIREDFAKQFRTQIGASYANVMDVKYVCQSVHLLPSPFELNTTRSKPWGTGHALWCVRDVIDGPFIVVNADDYYGPDSFKMLKSYFDGAQVNDLENQFAMVAFQLSQTLSDHGSVSRGICSVGQDNLLTEITEEEGIYWKDVGGPGARFSGDEMVSMNCWGFTPSIFPALERELNHFLANYIADDRQEFYLPEAVSAMIRRNEFAVKVLQSEEKWYGVTYPEDKEMVVAALRDKAPSGGKSGTANNNVE